MRANEQVDPDTWYGRIGESEQPWAVDIAETDPDTVGRLKTVQAALQSSVRAGSQHFTRADLEHLARERRAQQGEWRVPPHLRRCPECLALFEVVYEGVPSVPAATLEKFKALSIPCAVASNSPKLNVDMVLDELDIRKYFDVVIDSNQVTKGKPDPQPF